MNKKYRFRMVVPKPTGKDGKPFKPKEIKPKKKRGGGVIKKFPKKPSPVRKIGGGVGKSKDYPGIEKIIELNKKGKKRFAKGGESKFGMLSVKAGIDNNPNPTKADRIAGATMNKPKKAMMGLAVQVAKKAKDKGAKGAEFLSPVAMLRRAAKKDGGMMAKRMGGGMMKYSKGGMKQGYGAARKSGEGLQDEKLTPGKTMDYYKDLM